METANKIKIFLVDDDALFLKSLQIEFMEHADFIVETYTTGELCVHGLTNNSNGTNVHYHETAAHKPDIIILDYHLDGIDKNAMNGIATLDKIKALDADIPVIMLSSQDKIEVAINAMHHKATDYVVKSETAFMRLQKIITTIFQHKKIQKELNWYMERM
jgi:two-component system, OmpR family, response regulator